MINAFISIGMILGGGWMVLHYDRVTHPILVTLGAILIIVGILIMVFSDKDAYSDGGGDGDGGD